MLTADETRPGTSALGASAQPRRTSPAERRAAGKKRRAAVPLDSHASFSRDASSADAVTLLEEQAASRLPELGLIPYWRMLQYTFAFYRIAARVMAADLA